MGCNKNSDEFPSQVAIIDCPIGRDSVNSLHGTFVLSTNPLATFALSSLGIDPICSEDVLSTEDLLSVHARVADLMRQLQIEFSSTDLAARYPNPFQLHAFHLTILFFSLLSKLCEFERIFERVRGKMKSKDLSVLLFTAHKEARLPSYPLREDDAIYAWLLDRLSAVEGFRLKWQRACIDGGFASGLTGETRFVRFIFRQAYDWAKKVKHVVRIRTRIQAVLQKFYRILQPARAVSVVLGWRTYQAASLSDRELSDWGLNWCQPHEVLIPDGNKIHLRKPFASDWGRHERDQTVFESAFRHILTRVLSRTLSTEQFNVLQPIVESITASMKEYTLHCSALDAYLVRTHPAVFVSSSLSGSLSDRLLALLCRRRGIPVIGLQHGGSYGDLEESCASIGIALYLVELELCDTFITWGPGTARALSHAQVTYSRHAHQTRLVAGSPLSIPSPDKPTSRFRASSPSISKVLYVIHNISVNVLRVAWLREKYIDYVFSMCDLFSHLSSDYPVIVKLSPASDHWQGYLNNRLHGQYPQLELVQHGKTVAELANETDFVIIDIPATALCEVLPLPVHVATVELMADMYPGHQIVKPEALELLRRRCLVAPTYTELRSVVEECLTRPDRVDWPDLSNHDYFYQFVKNPADVSGLESYEQVLSDVGRTR